MSELRPCPFCGNKLIKPCRQQLPELSAPAFWFRCACCGAESGPSKNHPGAVTGWNSRAESPELDTIREQVKVLREACQSGIDALGGIMSYYGTGLQVINWHLNGDPEPWDNFFDGDGDGCGESLEILSRALAQTKPKDGE